MSRMNTTKKLLWHGLLSSLLSAVAGVVYFEIYQYLLLTEFDAVINWGSIIGASTFGCVLMMLGYWALVRFKMTRYLGWVNALYAVLSFLSIFGAMDAALPYEVSSPELFPGLAVPMHFFPAMVFFGLAPFFWSIDLGAEEPETISLH